MISDPIETSIRQRAELAVTKIGGSGGLKSVNSAKSLVKILGDGRIHVAIEHDPIKKCCTKQIKWWFENIARETDLTSLLGKGPPIKVYHLWHHKDHISVTSPGSGFRQGAISRIRENFGTSFKVDAKVMCTRLDLEEFNFDILKFGIRVGEVVHRYKNVGDNCHFYAETTIGVRWPLVGRFVNWIARTFFYTQTTGEQWIKHNVEETGQTEKIVPYLYKHMR